MTTAYHCNSALFHSTQDYTMNNKNTTFLRFCEIISTLRGVNGCPWDKKQTSHSLKKYILEETNELLESIDNKDPVHICEEAGDVLFLIALLAEIHTENGTFTFEDILSTITEKMIRRHPHVFANTTAGSQDELNAQWEKIKSEERSKKTN